MVTPAQAQVIGTENPFTVTREYHWRAQDRRGRLTIAHVEVRQCVDPIGLDETTVWIAGSSVREERRLANLDSTSPASRVDNLSAMSFVSDTSAGFGGVVSSYVAGNVPGTAPPRAAG